MKKSLKYFLLAGFIGSFMMTSCVSDPNSPGVEYMPDMYRSPAVEAYVDYAEVEGRYDEDAAKLIEEKFSFLPPNGTMPYYGSSEELAVMMPFKYGGWKNIGKTHGLFDVEQDEDGRYKADSAVNPIAWSKEVEDEGKELYEMFCLHCHSETGDGQGSVVTNSLGKFPTPGPYKDTLTPGGIFYTITYGKNAMGSHASQLNIAERWKVVHYVRKLIGKGGGDSEEEAESEEETNGAEEAEGNEGSNDDNSGAEGDTPEE